MSKQMHNHPTKGIVVSLLLSSGLLLAVLLSNCATEQLPTSPSEKQLGPSAGGFVSPKLLSLSIPLRDHASAGLHQSVSTASETAQSYYDQGITYLSAYAWVEAARSFNEALRLDPPFAMACLGLARASVGLEALGQAREHIERGLQLAQGKRHSMKELEWLRLGLVQIEALSEPADSERMQQRHRDYKAAIENLIRTDPDDAHAWALRGNAEEPHIGGRGQSGGAASIVYYKTALRRNPEHIASHHFLTHSYENIGRYELAVAHAQRYAQALPDIPHAQHMYGHLLPRVGSWEGALPQLLKADQLHRQRFQEEDRLPESDWHFGHNLTLLGAVQARLGNEEEAERSFREAFGLESRRFLSVFDREPWVEYLLSRQRFPEALEAAETMQKRPGLLDSIAGAALAGESQLGLKQLKKARQALQRAQNGLEQLSRQVSAQPGHLRRHAPVRMQHFVRFLQVLLALQGLPDPASDQQTLGLADRIAAARHMDGWSLGLLRLYRLRSTAKRANRNELVQALQSRIERVDPKASPEGSS